MISAYYWPCLYLSPIFLGAPDCKALFSVLVSACALSIYCGHGSSHSPDQLINVLSWSSPIYGLPCSMCAVLPFLQASVYVSSGGRAKMIWEVHYLRKNTNHDRGVPDASSNRRLHV